MIPTGGPIPFESQIGGMRWQTRYRLACDRLPRATRIADVDRQPVGTQCCSRPRFGSLIEERDYSVGQFATCSGRRSAEQSSLESWPPPESPDPQARAAGSRFGLRDVATDTIRNSDAAELNPLSAKFKEVPTRRGGASTFSFRVERRAPTAFLGDLAMHLSLVKWEYPLN